MQISVIIVTWNVRELLRANLSRLFSLHPGVSFEVLVVDNGSVDGTATMVRRDFPQVKLIRNDWDAGFAGPNNQALRLARGEVAILLNPDMLVDPGALETAYRQLTGDRSIGVLGIKLLGHGGKPIGSVRRLPTFSSQLCTMLKLDHLFPHLIDRYMAKDFDYDRSQDVDQVRGSFFAFRRELLDSVGYLDDGYHIWFEEVDYCLRAKAAGFRIRYTAEATAHDYVGRGIAQMKYLERQEIFTDSMIRYFRKHHPRWQAFVLAAAQPLALFACAMMDIASIFRRSNV